MLIGILSDSHDQAERVGRAVSVLTDAGAEYFFHCGDLCDQPVLDHLAGLNVAFVWGNNDFDRPQLQRYAESLGIRCLGTLGVIDVGGKRFAITHGDRPALIRSALEAPGVDYVLLGHTHVMRDERIGGVRILNPGALQRATLKTVALLETSGDRVEFFRIDESAAT